MIDFKIIKSECVWKRRSSSWSVSHHCGITAMKTVNFLNIFNVPLYLQHTVNKLHFLPAYNFIFTFFYSIFLFSHSLRWLASFAAAVSLCQTLRKGKTAKERDEEKEEKINHVSFKFTETGLHGSDLFPLRSYSRYTSNWYCVIFMNFLLCISKLFAYIFYENFKASLQKRFFIANFRF